MDMLKRNLFWIICGLSAAGGLVLSGMGYKDASARNSMGGAAGLLTSVRQESAASRIKNRRALDDAQRRVDAIRSNRDEVMAWAERRNRRTPLVEGIFPAPSKLQKAEFRDAYLEELSRLYGLLRGGEPPTLREEKDMADKIRNERPRGGAADSAGEPEKKDYEDWGPITDHGARTLAASRAAIVKAMGIYCYVDQHSDAAALEVVGDVSYAADAYSLAEGVLWSAQRQIWVQKDVVESLAGLNERAAERLSAAGETPWVGTLPVKDFVSLRISDYLLNEDPTGDAKDQGLAVPRGDEPAYPSLYPGDSFTHRWSTAEGTYDVLRFTVKLVVDVRELPAVIDAISRDRFYTATRVSYRGVADNIGMTGKIYGEGPVVMAVLDFEAYYFGNTYRRWMPDDVLARLGAVRPGAEEAGGS